MIKHIMLCTILLISLNLLNAKFTGFPEQKFKGEDTSLKTVSEMIIVKEKIKQDTLNMEYERPVKRLTEEERREKIIASLDSLSFTEAYKAVKGYERTLFLTKYLESKPNRKDIIKSFVDTTLAIEKNRIENTSKSQYIRLITAIWCSKKIWDNSNKEDRIFFLTFLIDELMPIFSKEFDFLISERGLNHFDNKTRGLNGVCVWNLDVISTFYADIFNDYKILENGGHHPVEYYLYVPGYNRRHQVYDPEKLIDNLKILRQLIIEEK